ncbi:MAG: M23 family metallopeptidase [Rickettsiales bacterium]|jgi:murein DD-endopeptidase MepM/ murein hydrolase activator NlpD|nr:M23 family metallopeptidase [Rickettsiales bacterium]
MRIYSISLCAVAGILEAAPKLCGVASQGGILFGESDTHTVYFNGKSVSKDGTFAIGLGMDAPEKVSVKFCPKGFFKSCESFEYAVRQRKWPEQKVNVPDKFISYPKETADRIKRENKLIRAAREGWTDGAFFMEARPPLPLDSHKISGVFGSRRVFNGIPKNPHNGLDLAAAAGTQFGSIAPGTVVLADDFYMTGKTVFIDHGNRIFSAYFHMKDIYVNVGDEVSAGTILGEVGSTGRSSGPHLHLGIYWEHTALDPEFFIK